MLDFFKPIPLRAEDAATALGYHGQPVDLTIAAAREPLVQAKDYGLASQSYYARTDGNNSPYNKSIPGALAEVWMRKTVAEKLQQVNQVLLPRALELHVIDAYRPIETQQSLWDHFIEMGRRELNTDDPSTLREFAGQFASQPDGFDAADPLTWPTHNTGGAVDVTLINKESGRLLDMGSGFDQSTPLTFTDVFEREGKDCANIEALNNRRILYNAMTSVGFANYPYEWWHFDYGTQMWLQNGADGSNCAAAWYGPASLT